MANGGVIERTWQEACVRFGELESFISISNKSAPAGQLSYSRELYSSWILMAYAAHESAIKSYGQAAMKVLARVAPTPDQLPEAMAEAHQKRTLQLANEIASKNANRGDQRVDLGTHFRTAYTREWAITSVLMRLDRNAWANNIRELLKRVEVEDSAFSWLREPWEHGSETLESRVDALVRERNLIAHGDRPDSLLSEDVMRDWIAEVKEFSRRVKCILQARLATSFAALLDEELGDLDPFGPKMAVETVALILTHRDLAVSDHVLLLHEDGRIAAAYIKSIQSAGTARERVSKGSARIAVTLNTAAAGCRLYAPA